MNFLTQTSYLQSLNDFVHSPYFYIIVFIDLALRGVSLWRSAQKGQKVWFVALLIVNSMGILPIIYLLLNKKPKANY